MGTRGPAPKPEDARAGHNAKSEKAEQIVVRGQVAPPDPRHTWSDEVTAIYQSFIGEPHTRRWGRTDWQHCLLYCDAIENYYRDPSAANLGQVNQMGTRLGATDVDRLRAGIDIKRVEDEQDEGAAARLRLLKGKAAGE